MTEKTFIKKLMQIINKSGKFEAFNYADQGYSGIAENIIIVTGEDSDSVFGLEVYKI